MIRNIIELNDDQKKKVEELVNNSLKEKDIQAFFGSLIEIIGISVNEIADSYGIPKSSLYRMVEGVCQISDRNLIKFCRGIGLTEEQFYKVKVILMMNDQRLSGILNNWDDKEEFYKFI